MRGKKRFAVILTGVVVMAAAMGFMMYLEWLDYQEKMEILYVTLEQEYEGNGLLETVTGILKGQLHMDAGYAQDRLGEYGYEKVLKSGYTNRYQKKLYHNWCLTASVFGVLCLAFFCISHLTGREDAKRRREELQWLYDNVLRLRERAAECFSAEGGSTERGLPAWEEQDAELGCLTMALTALEDSIWLLGGRARAEKEGTKVLVTDISHQLKTPVAALKTSFDIIQSDHLSDAERREFLDRCGIQVLRLEELVGALVNISRMETGMITIRRERKKLFDTLLLAVSRIYPRAEEKDIEIVFEAEEMLKQQEVFHDAKWLSEAFLNVLENAVKYSGSRTRITIRMIRMNICLRVEIEDEGIGIPKKEWNRIFQRFYRGEAKEVQEASGSGVGLYLAREITARHDGTLVVASPRGRRSGSCFVFQLPCPNGI